MRSPRLLPRFLGRSLASLLLALCFVRSATAEPAPADSAAHAGPSPSHGAAPSQFETPATVAPVDTAQTTVRREAVANYLVWLAGVGTMALASALIWAFWQYARTRLTP